MSSPQPDRVIFRKVLKTEADILRFCNANRVTILQCGDYLHVFNVGNFTADVLRQNKDFSLAFNCLGYVKLTRQQADTVVFP